MILLRRREASCFCQMSKAREDDMDAFSLFIVIHDRCEIRFWHDPRLGISPKHFPILYHCSISRNALIANFKKDQRWSITSTRNFNDWEVEDYMQLILLLSNSFLKHLYPIAFSETTLWRAEGHFSINSCYNTLTVSNPEKQFWKSNFPSRVKYSPWICYH